MLISMLCVISYLYGFTNSKLRQSIVPVKEYVQFLLSKLSIDCPPSPTMSSLHTKLPCNHLFFCTTTLLSLTPR
ncbi:hypothetical protein ACJW30_01G330200 [Castanea mollissima]